MAPEYQIYLCPMIQPTALPIWRAKACLYLNRLGDEYSVFWAQSRNVGLVFAAADAASHTDAQADADVTRILPVRSVPLATIQANLNTALSTVYTPAQLTAIRTKAEFHGIRTDGLTGASTWKQLLARVVSTHYLDQRMEGEGDNVADFWRANLDNQVSTISAAVRSRVAGWMTRHGIDSSWIVGTTTVREVVAYIHDRLVREELPFFEGAVLL